MARQREDLTGRKFNSLTVISYNEEVSVQKKGAHWNCKCDCGNECVVWSSCLKRGDTTSCGCSIKKDLTGQRFGRLVVVSLNEEVSKQKKNSYWNCKCDCGNETIVRSTNLKNGATTSCGCSRGRRGRKEDLTGQRFGRLIVISYNEEVSKQKKGTNLYWNCKCDCGNETIVRGSCLSGGATTSCGCYKKDKMKELNEEMWQDEEMKWKLGYKGGITPASKHLRGLNEQWFDYCKKQANYTCELTGKVGGNLHTHHLKAFSTIVKEAHELHNIQVKPQVKDYTEEELHKLEEYVASWHKDTSNAVVLNEEVHMLFHKLYGKGGNTPEQYEEFKQRYLDGEFEGLI